MPAKIAPRGQFPTDPSQSPARLAKSRSDGESALLAGQRPFWAARLRTFLLAFLLLAATAAFLLPERALALDEDAGVGSSGRPWRVAYLEGGPYRDFAMILAGLAKGLWELGIIEEGEMPAPAGKDARDLWGRLSQKAGGDKLIFLADGFYSGGWDDETFQEEGAGLIKRLQAGEIDLVLAMGTQASLLLAASDHRVPTLSISATDPVAAGISQTTERSGLDHLHVQVESGRIERQLAMFHNLICFSSLGVPLDSNVAGMATMGEQTIRRVAQERGFELVECRTDLETASAEARFENLVGCLKSLSQASEAVYLTVNQGMSDERMAEILAPMAAKGLPTFSQKGPAETRLGVLMSLAEDDFLTSGRFKAEVVRDVLKGRLPGEIPQLYLPPLTMALNFDTAVAIGWDPPFELLAVLDEIATSERGPSPNAAQQKAESQKAEGQKTGSRKTGGQEAGQQEAGGQ